MADDKTEKLGEAYCDLRDAEGCTLGMIASWIADDAYACQGGGAERTAKVLRAYDLLREASRLLDEAGVARP